MRRVANAGVLLFSLLFWGVGSGFNLRLFEVVFNFGFLQSWLGIFGACS